MLFASSKYKHNLKLLETTIIYNLQKLNKSIKMSLLNT